MYKTYTYNDQEMKVYINAENVIYITLDTIGFYDSDQYICLDVEDAKDFVNYLSELIKQIENNG